MDPLITWIAVHRWRAAAAGVLLLAGLVLLVEALPRWTALWGQYQTVQADQRRIKAVDTWAAEKVRIGQRRRMLKARYDRLYVSLPHIDQMSLIVRTLQQQADSVGGTLTHIRPGERIQHATFDELPLQVELAGTFHAVGAFVRQVESSRYLIKVDALTLSAPDAWPGPLHAVLTLHLILLKEDA